MFPFTLRLPKGRPFMVRHANQERGKEHLTNGHVADSQADRHATNGHATNGHATDAQANGHPANGSPASERANGHVSEPQTNGRTYGTQSNGHSSTPSVHPELVEGRTDVAGVSAAGVWASYGERGVLRGLKLEAAQGTLTALAGPNGVGKSTLLRLISGAMRPDRGHVWVMGNEISAMSGRERAKLVGMVPQNPELPRGASALEVVLMGRNPHLRLLSWETADDVEIALESLRMTDAEHLAERPVHQLSGGERQRVAIAMALAQQTPVILLDEPTASLDLAYQPTIMRLLRELAAEGRTMITAVHDLTLAGQFCDQVALVSEGRVVACGPPEATLTTAAIRQVYDADTLVLEHPETGKPIVVAR